MAAFSLSASAEQTATQAPSGGFEERVVTLSAMAGAVGGAFAGAAIGSAFGGWLLTPCGGLGTMLGGFVAALAGQSLLPVLSKR